MISNHCFAVQVGGDLFRLQKPRTSLSSGMGLQDGRLKRMAAARRRPSGQVCSLGLPMQQQMRYSWSA